MREDSGDQPSSEEEDSELGSFRTLRVADVVLPECPRLCEMEGFLMASAPDGNFHSQEMNWPSPSKSGNSDRWFTPNIFSSDNMDSALFRGMTIRSTIACFPLCLRFRFIAGESSMFFSFPNIRS